MKRRPAEYRLALYRQNQCKDAANGQAAEKHDLPDTENLGDMFHYGVVGGNHRHRYNDHHRSLEVIELHALVLVG
jgi:hypothetical protein